ncbi:MAG: hypothetical protein EB107_07375 [Proteobacteria bacterium]|nr:hypothetical protein [Pseudomonadota bacterium]
MIRFQRLRERYALHFIVLAIVLFPVNALVQVTRPEPYDRFEINWDSFGPAPSAWAIGHDLEVVSPSGIMYAVGIEHVQRSLESWNYLLITPPDGAPYLVGGSGARIGRFHYICGMAVAPDGNLVVAEMGNSRVQILSPYGKPVHSFGEMGERPGQFLAPCGLAVDHTGSIFVADAFGTRVQKFSQDGTFIGMWGSAYQAPFDFADVDDEEDDRGTDRQIFAGFPRVDVGPDEIVVERFGTERSQSGKSYRRSVQTHSVDQMVPAAAAPDTVSLSALAVQPTLDHVSFLASLEEPYRSAVGSSLDAILRTIFGEYKLDRKFDSVFLIQAQSGGPPLIFGAIHGQGSGGFTYSYAIFPGETRRVWERIGRHAYIQPTTSTGVIVYSRAFSPFGELCNSCMTLTVKNFFEWDGQKFTRIGWSLVPDRWCSELPAGTCDR